MNEIDKYIESLDSNKNELASILVNFMREEYPDAEETFDNNRPTYKIDGKTIISFAAQKSYFSFYTDYTQILELIKELMPGASLGKGCVRIKYSEKNSIEILTDMCREITGAALSSRGNNITDYNALKKWKSIKPEHQQLLLDNVFCPRCKITSMVDYTIQNDKYGIVLKGKCKRCGGNVVRLVED